MIVTTKLSGEPQPIYFCGIDVQIKRGCCFYVIDGSSSFIESGWSKGNATESITYSLYTTLMKVCNGDPSMMAIGIDVPRMPLKEPRKYFWDAKKNRWRDKSKNDVGYGRHSEVVVNALKLANPQWTPLIHSAPQWMKLGFDLFKLLESSPYLYEVFPSASYSLLNDIDDVRTDITFNNFKSGPKDKLDAVIAAVTVKEFTQGRGSEVGGGDDLGTIILSEKVSIVMTKLMIFHK